MIGRWEMSNQGHERTADDEDEEVEVERKD